MTNRTDIIRSLRQLQELDNVRASLGPKASKSSSLAIEIEELREKLPTAILKHYDQRHARGKPVIAPVKSGVCGACHISVARASVTELRRSGGSIAVCENCGVFIYLDDSEANGPQIQGTR